MMNTNEPNKDNRGLNLSKADHMPLIQIFVFKGEEYLGWDCFPRATVTIGSAEEADLSLRHESVSDIHAVLSVIGGRLMVSFDPSGDSDPSECREIGPLDSLVIGPFTIKAKLNRNGKACSDVNHVSCDEAKVLGSSDQRQGEDEVRPGSDSQRGLRVGQEVSPEGGPREDAHEFQAETVSIPQSGEGGTARYDLIFDGRIRDGFTLEEVKKNLGLLFRKDPSQIERLFSGRKAILKRNTEYRAAKELKTMFESAGALCSLEQTHDQNATLHKKPGPDSLEAPHEDENACEQVAESGPGSPEEPNECAPAGDGTSERQNPARVRVREEDDEDDDEEEFPAAFSLKEKIKDGAAAMAALGNRVTNQEILLEVVQSRNESIVDVQYLRAQEKYFVRKDKGLFCLAENKGAGEIVLYLDDETTCPAEATNQGTSGRAEGKTLDRQRLISRYEEVVIHRGAYEYLLRQTAPSVSPQVKATPKRDREYARHFGRSVVFHVVLLVILGMMPTYKPDTEIQDRARFVQVDTRQIEEMTKKNQPPELPKKAPEVMNLKEEQLVRIDKREVNTPASAKKVLGSQSSSVKVASSRSSGSGSGTGTGTGGGTGNGTGTGTGGGNGTGAGGPVGDGNVATRNVHQAGLLSMLGDNIGIKPTDAMAAVTNLDAVSSPVGTKANFKVGGIVGKIGGSKVEIPKAGIVNTKGSSQVLRTGGGNGGPGGTGGSGGPGNGTGGGGGGEMRVAALDKGSTGTQQVKAKVSAQLSKTVKVSGGGMSREEVKRIIDQHLDEITRCYETALVANPSLMGRVVFEWKILLSGKVGEVRIKSSTLSSTDIHSCIQSSIKSWEFPEPSGSEVVVSYPFIFDIVGF